MVIYIPNIIVNKKRENELLQQFPLKGTIVYVNLHEINII